MRQNYSADCYGRNHEQPNISQTKKVLTMNMSLTTKFPELFALILVRSSLRMPRRHIGCVRQPQSLVSSTKERDERSASRSSRFSAGIVLPHQWWIEPRTNIVV